MIKRLLVGIIFIFISLVFFAGSFSYETGTISSMGPGYFPKSISVILFICGIVVLLKNDR